MNSILTSVKKNIGIPEEDTVFDPDIIMHINTTFTVLNQLGVGPEEGYAIEDASSNWSEYLQDNLKLNNVKTYVYLRVRMLFDPPASSSLIDAIERTIKELEWRLTITTDEQSKSVQ